MKAFDWIRNITWPGTAINLPFRLLW